MNDSLEYIEAYFQKQLSLDERRQFELQCEQDDLFARDVALYITTREAAKQALAEQKKEQWRTLSQERKTNVVPPPVKSLPVRRLLPYAAAACLVLFISLYFFSGRNTFNKQVASYIQQEELSSFSQTMGTYTDSLGIEQGKNAYNKKNYDQALHIFVVRSHSDENDWEAKMYAGLVYLKMKNYDSALVYFNGLSGLQLQSNLGPYYTALTLLERNKNGDREKAKQALHAVTSTEHYDRKKEARDLLHKLE